MTATPKLIDTVATVERNDLIASASSRSYGYLRLRLDQPIPVLPGQFAMIKPRGIFEPLLRRAMAYYRSAIVSDALMVDFIYQVLGRGTQALAKLRAGDLVEFLGSLGNTYDIEAARGREALLVAGGVGSAALFMLAEKLMEREVSAKLFIGGASHADLCGLKDFVELLSSDHVISATIDGSHGEKGFVTAPFEKHLQANRDQPVIVYACGPDPMLHRVSQIAGRFAAPAQLSLEAPMACGFGICVGCAVAVKHDCPEGFVYKKVCMDGPIFWSNELSWGEG
ncbi:MAG: dihydroorotate dehydrogenase electron transfer subunit [Acidobacteria bacterium]|nr:dihydroorotate dehydrogenase electron transfer subunit [Acidobacteriota bacterium]